MVKKDNDGDDGSFVSVSHASSKCLCGLKERFFNCYVIIFSLIFVFLVFFAIFFFHVLFDLFFFFATFSSYLFIFFSSFSVRLSPFVFRILSIFVAF